MCLVMCLVMSLGLVVLPARRGLFLVHGLIVPDATVPANGAHLVPVTTRGRAKPVRARGGETVLAG